MILLWRHRGLDNGYQIDEIMVTLQRDDVFMGVFVVIISTNKGEGVVFVLE